MEVEGEGGRLSAARQSADPVLCPLCGQSNQCAAEVETATGVKQPPCWCTEVKFEAALLSNLPEPARGTACICAVCAQAEAS
jgi:hypothetical protein